MTLTYRLVKGSALTFAEADGNISDLDGRLINVEGATAANPIDSITVTGDQMTFHYTTAAGGGSDTVTIPTAQWNARGDWLPSTHYSINDLVVVQASLYLVKVDHISDTTFDPGFQIGAVNVYQLIIGPLGQTQSAPLTTSTYTLQGTDNLMFYRCTNAGGCVITVPPSSSVAILLDSEISFRQSAAGGLSFVAGAGVTMPAPTGFALTTNYNGVVVTLQKVGTDTWDIFGALTSLS
jgi:hypothetical protein